EDGPSGFLQDARGGSRLVRRAAWHQRKGRCLMEADAQHMESVERGRIERIVEVLSYASVGSFAEALERAEIAAHDAFGELEEALRLVISELKIARARNDEAMQALEHSKAELEDKVATI